MIYALIILFLCTLCGVLFAGLFYMTKKAFELQDQLETMAPRLEQSYTRLTSAAQKIAKIAAHPLTSDDPFVKQVSDAVKDSHDAVRFAIEVVGTTGEDDEQEDET